jgi:EmrB/QacA subfamily drug resistance transporter
MSAAPEGTPPVESTPPSENTPASPPTPPRKARRQGGEAKLALLLACGAAFMSVFDFSAVNLALPDLRRDFSAASLPTLSWVITGYLVFFAAVLPSAGRLADVLGRRRLFQWSIVAFGVTSALSAAAPNEGILIAVRALQGAAAAAMSPSGLGLVLTRTAPARIMPALGTWSAVSSLAAVAGPGLGGVLVDTWGWRAIFVINVPIVVAILGVAGRLSRDDPRAGRLPDLLGTALLTVGVGAVVVGISRGGDWGWRSGPLLAALAGGVVLVVASLARSARHPSPAFELDLWRDRTFAVANATMLPLNVALLLGSVVVGPLFLTAVWGYSVLEAGLAGTPAAFAIAVASALTGRLATTPAARRVAAVGGCLLFAGAAVFLGTALGAEPRLLTVYLPAGLVSGVGYGAAFTAVFGAGSISIPPTRLATGNALLTTMRILGAALGTAAVAAILAAPGDAGAGAADPYLTAYLFGGVVAVVAAAIGVGLVRHAPAEAAEAAEAGETAEGRAPSASRVRQRVRLAAAVAVVVSLLGVGAFAATTGTTEGCAGGETRPLRVAVAPDIEPAVHQAVDRFNGAGNEIAGACIRAEVTAADPAGVTTLLGQGAALGDPSLPDAWIPDSSLWTSLLLALTDDRLILEAPGTALAQTPVVAAMPRALADELRGRGVRADTSWEDLAAASGRFTTAPAAPATGSPPAIPPGLARLRLPDPTRNAAGLAALVILDQLHAGEPDQAIRLTGTVRNLQEHTIPDVRAGFAAFAADDRGRYPILAVPEQAVFTHNRRHPADSALAIYPREGTLSMDYPYLITTHDPVTLQAARLLETELRGPQTQADIRALGFRSADGATPSAFGPQPATSPPPRPAPQPADVLKAVQAWQKLSQGVRNLTLIDISASTTEPVGPGLTRLEATTQAARSVIAAMPDDAELGVWLYARRLHGELDWAELVPVGPLRAPYGPATRRRQLDFGLSQIAAVPEGRTGLYDTVLAAYRTMQRSYDPKPVNSLLLLTDGTNDDPGGISLSGLLAALLGEYDPARPVQIVVVGFGDDVDRGALDQIAGATRGSVHLARTPQQVQQILLTAMSRRTAGR